MQNGVFVVLLIALVTLLAYFAREYRAEYDLTQNARNTLSQQARDVLAKLGGPVRVTVYATRQDARGDARKQVQDFLTPYQRIKPGISVNFVDPREEPKLAQAAGIRVNGESVVDYNQKSEHLTDYSEQSFINLLMRLARSGERLVMALGVQQLLTVLLLGSRSGAGADGNAGAVHVDRDGVLAGAGQFGANFVASFLLAHFQPGA